MKNLVQKRTAFPLIGSRVIQTENKRPPGLLSGTPFVKLLTDKLNRRTYNESRRAAAASRIDLAESQHQSRQADFYNVVLRRRQEQSQEERRSAARSVLANSMEKFEHRSKVEANARKTNLSNEHTAHKHYENRIAKIADAEQFRKTKRSICAAKNSIASSSRIRQTKEELERNFSVKTLQNLEQKQKHAQVLLTQQTERRRALSRENTMRYMRAKSKHQAQCETAQSRVLTKCVSTFERLVQREQQLQKTEMGLLCEKIKNEKEHLDQARNTKAREQRCRKERILEEINDKNLRMTEAAQRREQYKQIQSSLGKLSSVRMSDVLKRSQAIRESMDAKRKAHLEKKAHRYKQITAYKQECEKIKEASRLRNLR